LLDFSKAFDKVSHEKLALKLHDYGITGPALKWVKGFLDNRHQSVIVDGSSPEPLPVSSGVPQGSVLGPLLFVIYINVLPMNVKVRLFADGNALYLTISISSQSEILHKDLDNLERWSHKWDMEFNPSKCQVFHIIMSKYQIHTQYTLHNCILESVSSAKYPNRFTPNLLNILPTKLLFVLSYSTAPQFGVHSQIQISLNLKLSNVELLYGSNMTMD